MDILKALYQHLKDKLAGYRVELSGQSPMIIVSSRKESVVAQFGESWRVLLIVEFDRDGFLHVHRSNNNDAFPLLKYEIADPSFSPTKFASGVRSIVDAFDKFSSDLLGAMGGGKKRRR